jgi:hypothetical protein
LDNVCTLPELFIGIVRGISGETLKKVVLQKS